MKTIRTNTFETNSSSTHALSINFKAGTQPKLLPINFGEKYVVKLGRYAWISEESIPAKIKLLTYYLLIHGTTEAERFKFFKNTLEEFLKSPVVFEGTENFSDVPTDSKERKELISDNFSYFMSRDYGMGVENFISAVENILSTKENILGFVFSEGNISSEYYYDG